MAKDAKNAYDRMEDAEGNNSSENENDHTPDHEQNREPETKKKTNIVMTRNGPMIKGPNGQLRDLSGRVR